MENRYNLIDEKWIPVFGRENAKSPAESSFMASLSDIFADSSGILSLRGNAVEKIAVFKLLLAIVQSACPLEKEQDWQALGLCGMRKRTREYMQKWHDSFWLYGEKPFLQFPALKEKCRESKQCCNFKIGIASGNNSVVTQFQTDTAMDDADKALLVIVLMNFALGRNGIMSDLYKNEKKSIAKPGHSINSGLLHSFVLMPSLTESVYINMLSEESIKEIHGRGNKYSSIGKAPWENMPQGVDDDLAGKLKESYMGRLIGLGRFILLEENKIYITEGIRHYGLNELTADPSAAVILTEKGKMKPLLADTNKRPWRNLPSLLSFTGNAAKDGFICCQLMKTLTEQRLKTLGHGYFYVWSGGLSIEKNTSGTQTEGDFVESKIEISREVFSDGFYENMAKAFEYMDNIAKGCENAIEQYFKLFQPPSEKKDKKGADIAGKGLSDYWQMCEKDFPDVIKDCGDSSGESIKPFEQKFYFHALEVYNEKCPKSTPRQLEAWAAGKNKLKSKLPESKGEKNGRKTRK